MNAFRAFWRCIHASSRLHLNAISSSSPKLSIKYSNEGYGSASCSSSSSDSVDIWSDLSITFMSYIISTVMPICTSLSSSTMNQLSTFSVVHKSLDCSYLILCQSRKGWYCSKGGNTHIGTIGCPPVSICTSLNSWHSTRFNSEGAKRLLCIYVIIQFF